MTTIVVFATSFLDPLLGIADDGQGASRLLNGLKGSEVHYRCERNPTTPIEASELRGVHAVIADLERYDASLLQRIGQSSGGSLGLIARYGVGYDTIDLPAATRCGVWVCNTPTAPTLPTAEWAISTILDVCGRRIQQHEWASRGRPKSRVSRLDLSGTLLGIVGAGAIGRQVAQLLQGFGLRILATDPQPNRRWAGQVGAQFVEPDRLYSEADVITLHAAVGRQIISKREIALMKPTTSLINCARAVLVDSRAVWEAVATGALWGYGIDDVWTESDLNIDGLNIVCSPHVGSDSIRGKQAMREISAHQVLDFLSGRRPRHLLNPEVAAPFDRSDVE